MKSIKRGLAVFLAVLLMLPTLPASAEEAVQPETAVADVVLFNTGNHTWSVVNKDGSDGDITDGDITDGDVTSGDSEDIVGDAYFEADGSYTINIPEANPFFPYEVQFTCNGEVTKQWFMTPDDSVEVGGHTFYVSAYFDGTAVTQMSLNVAGETVIVYPEEKEFTEDDGVMALSLLPLTEKYLTVDLSAYTPAELTMVSVDSIFTGDSALTDTDKVSWTYAYDDDYTISESGDKLDLSYSTSWSGSTSWQMIVGDDDQLAADNIRYIVRVKHATSSSWLTPTVYVQDSEGNRTNVSTLNSQYSDYSKEYRQLYMAIPEKELGDQSQIYVGLSVNPDIFSSTVYDHAKVYEGKFSTAAEAMAGTDITNQIFCSDMTKVNAGYVLQRYNSNWITMVTFDANNNVTGCLPFSLFYYANTNYLSLSLFEKTENGRNAVEYTSSQVRNGNDHTYTSTLYKEYAVNGIYCLTMGYYQNGTGNQSAVTAAYLGKYSSIAEATAAGATDVKAALFGDGYSADYSQGIPFTVFVGDDGTADQEVYCYLVKTEEGSVPKNSLNSGTSVNFYGLKDSTGASVDAYAVENGQDSYAEFNYLTILVGADVDLTSLAPVFSTSTGVKLYAAGSSAPEISGTSLHDFSNGPVQYTASAENGLNAKNYWLQVVKATDGAGNLYINSLADASSETKVENGVTYSTREMLLDGYHDDIHDIFLANMGTEAISALAVELSSDVVELDAYWTLSGNYDLSGFSTTSSTTSYGELPNLAKIRIKAKEGVENGAEISGTLTIKSGANTLMVLTLTGTIGDPCITTKEVPEAVKYVPYGTMIQNNNKYSWNQVTYQFWSGALPAGMEVKPNGELYGVPTEEGEFTFTVCMHNSYGAFSSDMKTYTLVVKENTDENVDAATDEGYDLTQRIQAIYLGSMSSSMDLFTTSQTMVSQGQYAEFVDVYLDGVKLTEGTDYTSEAGSTRITIMTQTLVQASYNSDGPHTLGIEFRTQDTDILKCAAQNYIVDSGTTPNGSGSNSNGGNTSGNGGSSTSGGSTSGGSTNYNSTTATEAGNTVTTVTYIVQSGDTLWKIAEKFYGSGQYWEKIFADNADVISNPNRIYVGQQFTIYLSSDNTGDTVPGVDGNTYTVEAGDTLWKIAKKLYGKGWYWRKLYQANADIISNPQNIYVGQVFVVPEQ